MTHEDRKEIETIGLKLDPKKCMFFQQSVRHLGHIVSKDDIHEDTGFTDYLDSMLRTTH